MKRLLEDPLFGLHMVPRIVLSVTALIGVLEVREEAVQATKSLRGSEKETLSSLNF